MWRIAATVVLRQWAGTIPALEAAPRALAAAGTAAPLEQLRRLGSAPGLTGEAQDAAGGPCQPLPAILRLGGLHLATRRPGIPQVTLRFKSKSSGGNGKQKQKASAYKMYQNARSRLWKEEVKDNKDYPCYKRAAEYNRIRESNPKLTHLEVLGLMTTWEGEEHVRDSIIKNEHKRHKSIDDKKKPAGLLNAYNMFVMEQSYLWDTMPASDVAMYQKQADEFNAAEEARAKLEAMEQDSSDDESDDEEVYVRKPKIPAYQVFKYVTDQKWQLIKEDKAAYKKYKLRADEYEAIREANPGFTHLQVLEQMTTWDGEEHVRTSIIEAADTQHKSMAEKKQAASYTHAYKIYTMELSYLWNSMEPTKKALYEKQAELANALRAKHPGLDLKEYLAKLPGVKKLLDEDD